ncbi:ShlB/FhaC/HecB family hemolysin secretion/activation protein [Tropicimonas sp.]|uniref:ShlB/FhaC/HecB family hemolysin secretion/activation protein n=1 Tax=Tropicimonas sp. TaxID=2067044 RepID=UPI003A83D2BB
MRPDVNFSENGVWRPARRGRSALTVGVLGVALLAMPGADAQAQTTGLPGVNAGSLQRQMDVGEPRVPQRRPAEAGAILLPGVTVDSVAAGVDDPGGPTLYLSGWKFTGNRLFDTAELRKVLSGVTGRQLSFSQIDRAARMIEAYYAENGYVARVTLPPQEVTGGVVLLDVQEGRYAGVAFEGTPPKRVKPEIIERIFDGNVVPGTALRPDRLDKPLLIANGLYGIALSGALAPGANPGETVLLLDGQDESPLATQLSFDNYGSRSIGEPRASVQLGLYSPLRRGDLLLARLTATEGSPDGMLRYSLPVGLRGAFVWADVGLMHYDVITSELRALDPTGRSLTRSIGVSYPLLISRDRNVSLTFSYGRDDLENEIRGDTVSHYHVSRAVLGLSGNAYDDFGGGGLTTFALSYSNGSASGTDIAGGFDDDFDIWRLSLARQQNLPGRFDLLAQLSAQKGPRGLDSSEEFFLGGPYGVRAYPIGEGDGPSGAIVNLELQYELTENWSVAGFYDHGWIADRTVSGEPSDYQLKGLGARLSWQHPTGWAADLTLARRLGDNPNAIDDPTGSSLDGRDQDGSLRKFRAWFELRKTF